MLPITINLWVNQCKTVYKLCYIKVSFSHIVLFKSYLKNTFCFIVNLNSKYKFPMQFSEHLLKLPITNIRFSPFITYELILTLYDHIHSVIVHYHCYIYCGFYKLYYICFYSTPVYIFSVACILAFFSSKSENNIFLLSS